MKTANSFSVGRHGKMAVGLALAILVLVWHLLNWYAEPLRAQVPVPGPSGNPAGGTIAAGTINQLTLYTAATAVGSLGSLGTTTTVLHGNGAGLPSFSVVTPSDASGNTSGTGNFALVNTPSFTTPAIGAATGTSITLTGLANAATYNTATNCSSSASPAVCASAAAGSIVVAAAATTVTVNTTAVTANSQVLVIRDDSLGTKLTVTCNTATAMTDMRISARTGGTSFQITVAPAPTTNPYCLSYLIVN